MPEDRILFLNLIASPSGVADFAERFPKLRVVTAFIDQGLDEKKFVTYFLVKVCNLYSNKYFTDTSFQVWVTSVIDITLFRSLLRKMNL